MVDRLRHRHQFDRLRACGHRGRSGPIRLTFAPDTTPPAAAYAVNKAVGNAVVRNRVRRRLREQLRVLDLDHALAGGLYLVRVDPEAATLPSTALRTHLAAAIQTAAAKTSRR